MPPRHRHRRREPPPSRCLERCAGQHKAAVGGEDRDHRAPARPGHRGQLRQAAPGFVPRCRRPPRATGSWWRSRKAPTRDGRGSSTRGGRRYQAASAADRPARQAPGAGSFKLLDADVRPAHGRSSTASGELTLTYRFRARARRPTSRSCSSAAAESPGAGRRGTSSPTGSTGCAGTACSRTLTSPRAGDTASSSSRPGQRGPPLGIVPPLRRQVPGPRAARLRRRRCSGSALPAAAAESTRDRTCSPPAAPGWSPRCGGSVQARGSDPVLYGNWIVIDARGIEHRLSLCALPASGLGPRQGERVGPASGRPDREDGQRAHGRLHAPLRGLAIGLEARPARSTPSRS